MNARSSGVMRDTGAESYRLLRRAALRVAGTLLGMVSGALLVAGLVICRWRPETAARFQQWDLYRLERYFRVRVWAADDAGPRPGHMAGQSLIGIVTGWLALQFTFVLIVMPVGVLSQLLIAGPLSTVTVDFVTWQVSQPVFLTGWIYVLAAAVGLWAFAEFAGWLTAKWTGRTFPVERVDTLEERLGQLVTTRRGVVRAIDDERRRIERDLHDGVQQHVISLSMLLARARRNRDPDKVRHLLDRAHVQSQELIEEMRQVAWQIYPAALDELGLNQALTVVAQNSPITVELNDSLPSRPGREAESATYFVAREAITNAVKHSGATVVTLSLTPVRVSGVSMVRLVAEDDGHGGADPRGSGLQGLSRRVEALDGVFTVSSPSGGPTVITAEIPHE